MVIPREIGLKGITDCDMILAWKWGCNPYTIYILLPLFSVRGAHYRQASRTLFLYRWIKPVKLVTQSFHIKQWPLIIFLTHTLYSVTFIKSYLLFSNYSYQSKRVERPAGTAHCTSELEGPVWFSFHQGRIRYTVYRLVSRQNLTS